MCRKTVPNRIKSRGGRRRQGLPGQAPAGQLALARSRLSECGKRFAERSRCPPASRPSRRPPRHTRIPSALAAHHVAAQPTGAATAPWEYPARARKTSKSGTSSFVGKVYEITGRFCALCSKVGLVQFLAWNSKRVSEWIRALPGKPWFAQRFPPVSGNSAP